MRSCVCVHDGPATLFHLLLRVRLVSRANTTDDAARTYGLHRERDLFAHLYGFKFPTRRKGRLKLSAVGEAHLRDGGGTVILASA